MNIEESAFSRMVFSISGLEGSQKAGFIKMCLYWKALEAAKALTSWALT